MSEKEAVERVVRRVCKERLLKTGKGPGSKETRVIEDKVRRVAQESDNRKARR